MEKSRAKLCLELFLTFAKIGALTFGGGYAMIPIIEREAQERKGWIDSEVMLDIIAIAEATPGPISINAATFIGYRMAGLPGAACATLGTITPSFLIIFLLSGLLEYAYHYPAVRYAFAGIRAGVLALIVRVVIKMAKQCPKNLFSYILAAAAFTVVVFLGANVVVVILSAMVIGIAYALISGKAGDGEVSE